MVLQHDNCSPVILVARDTASQHALIKGYSSDEATNAIISLFWLSAASRCISPWIERVSSQDNIADEISRGEFARARRLAWQEVELPLGSIWPVILDAIESKDGVTRQHVEAIHGRCYPSAWWTCPLIQILDDSLAGHLGKEIYTTPMGLAADDGLSANLPYLKSRLPSFWSGT